ncbi:MAG: transposase [Candidatus Omnitrophica bacterium]|nr:transposase [Candidatus Omnitrophota bacterium]MDD5440657.1 transposase [Candidatus Omnitrophota bacterium]
MDIFHKRKDLRLKNFDYSNNGYYSITICTKNRQNIFGEIINRGMVLNDMGDIVRNTWMDLPNHHANIQLDEFVVMPNHVHGIIIINNSVGNRPACSFIECQKTNNLSIMIGSFKSTVSRKINKLNKSEFKWQKSFYDQIIRTDESLDNIRKYIVDNPFNWDVDKNNIKNCSIEVQAGLNPTR